MPTDYICNVRLIDNAEKVLGWAAIPSSTRGDQRIWANHAFVFEARETGDGVELAIHEPGLNVWTFVPLPQPISVTAGKVYTIRLDNPLLVFGTSDRPLPPVTVYQSVVVSPGVAVHG